MNCTHDLLGSLRLDMYSTSLPLDIMPLNFNIILGLPWLHEVKPQFDWDADVLIFDHKGKEIRIDASTTHKDTSTCPLVVFVMQFKKLAHKVGHTHIALVCHLNDIAVDSTLQNDP